LLFSYHIIHILKDTAFITCLVMIMLLLVEYVGAATRARGLLRLKKSPPAQLLAAALLGLMPGCIGGFATVALFASGAMNFGALVAAMIAGMGDEAFVMYASFPLQALALQGITLATALAAGGLVNLMIRKIPASLVQRYLTPYRNSECQEEQAQNDGAGNRQRHSHCRHEERGDSRRRVKLGSISLHRALLAVGVAFFVVAAASGMLGHTHQSGALLSERWINLLFLAAAAAMLIIIARANERFLEQHLWQHVVKRHFVKIFLWTLGSLIAIAALNRYIEAQTWVRGNQLYMVAAAMLIGLIPASGPHLVFVLLFAQGNIPFSALLANTIVQDGHAGIPLLAESKWGFACMKAIKVLVAAGAGLCGALFGF
jgi:hypothetical protein